MAMPDGTIGHAELKIGDSVIFLADEMQNPGNAKSPQFRKTFCSSFRMSAD
jgi:uncharacterized glyoxalase superfamily protein PhnB